MWTGGRPWQGTELGGVLASCRVSKRLAAVGEKRATRKNRHKLQQMGAGGNGKNFIFKSASGIATREYGL